MTFGGITGDSVAGRLLALALVVLLLLWAVIWIVTRIARLVLRRGPPFVAAVRSALLAWANRRHSWLARQLLSLLDPARSEMPGLALAAVALVGSAWAFLGILEDVVTGDPLVRADTAVYALLQGLRSPVGDAIMVTVTELGDTAVVIPVAAVATAWFLWRRAWHAAAYWLGAVVLASLFNSLVKFALSRPRPLDELYAGVGAFSFPSGHTTVNTAMYGFLGILVVRELGPKRGLPAAAAIAGFVAMIAFSRLYLGAHWFSDVAAGLAFGMAWISLLGVAYHRHRQKDIAAGGLLIAVGLALAIAGATNIYRQHATDLQRYAVSAKTVTLPASAWLAAGWQTQPARRTDLFGEFEEPLNVQWAGAPAAIDARLLADGWQRPPALTPGSALAWISPGRDVGKLPLTPLLQDGLAPALTFIRLRPGSARLALRLWATRTMIESGPSAALPLFLGAVSEERLEHPVWPFTIAATQPDWNGPRDALADDLDDDLGDIRLAARPAPPADAAWDGRVLLLQTPAP